MRLNQVKFKNWVEDIQKHIELSDGDIKELKKFYEENGMRNIIVATKYAISILKAKTEKELIVVGWNTTRYGKNYLTCFDTKNKELVTIAGGIAELMDDIMPMEKVVVQGNKRNGKIIAMKIDKKGKAEYSDLEIKDDIFDVSAGDKFILQHYGDVLVFEPIDWKQYDANLPISDQQRVPMYNKGLVSFTLTLRKQEGLFTINFRNIPIRFFSDIILEKELESPEQLQMLLSEIPFAVPVYITKEPEDSTDINGNLTRLIRATGFGMIPVPYDESLEKESIEKETEGGFDFDEWEEAREKTLEILNKHKDYGLDELKKELGFDDETFEQFIKHITVDKKLAYLPDPDTISLHDGNKKTEEDDDEIEW
ncbi:MAG: hypothetical protein DRM99_03655 [Thermoplasmata archaeon]|nr:MAG: hypothetical protein DRM99_03655 [Thermoplasmata archaeon]